MPFSLVSLPGVPALVELAGIIGCEVTEQLAAIGFCVLSIAVSRLAWLAFLWAVSCMEGCRRSRKVFCLRLNYSLRWTFIDHVGTDVSILWVCRTNWISPLYLDEWETNFSFRHASFLLSISTSRRNQQLAVSLSVDPNGLLQRVWRLKYGEKKFASFSGVWLFWIVSNLPFLQSLDSMGSEGIIPSL